MAKTYTVIIHRGAYPSDSKSGAKPITSCEVVPPGISSAYVVNVSSNAETVKEAQEIVVAAYPNLCTDVPRVAVATEVKES